MTKEEAKQKVAELVIKYDSLSVSEIKRYNEAATKLSFIEPLFRALGWNTEDNNEVAPEEKASNGRVDYAFKLNGVSQFYLEAKPLRAELTNETYIKQTVTYAYNKGVTWAVLTDFDELRLFNAQQNKPFITLKCPDYVANFEKLWLLSRESLEQGLLNKEASGYGALPPSLPVETRLFRQLRQWREELFKQLHLHNEKLSFSQIDEVIQKLFNRLIFIRTAEDREIEDKKLLAAVHQWEASHEGDLFDILKKIFREFDGYYDSELFAPQLLDTSEIFVEGDTIERIVSGLYEIPGGMASYDFSIIDADVLGAVYEQYLGYVAQVEKQRAKEAQSRLDLGIQTDTISLVSKKERRKEQGIYYTPKFVTDYIVKQTVGRFLAGHSLNEIRNIKILDPACGSGSFLIRAFDELLKYYASQKISKSEQDIDAADRISILTNNIFGVDLDKQAVEIARLNLLLRSLARRDILPPLTDNIRHGNSLVSGAEEELREYFGKNWEAEKPFNWEEKFEDIMARGGFDVVIGNPPYVRQEQFRESKPWLQKQYECYSGTADIYIYFFERAFKLLKDGGLLSFISPNKYFRAAYGEKLRKFLAERARILQLIDFGDAPVFEAITYPSIIVLQKMPAGKNQTRLLTWNETSPVATFASVFETESYSIPQKELAADGWRLEPPAKLRLLEKLRGSGKPLGEYVDGRFYRGIVTGLNEAFVVDRATRDSLIAEHKSSAEVLKPFLRGKDIKRWKVNFAEQYLLFVPWHFPLHNDESISGASERAETEFRQKYPAIFRHLFQFKEQLLARNKDETGIRYEWYALQRCAATYWKEFDRPKIVWGNLAIEPKFAFADSGYYVSAPANIVVSDSRYLLGVLNSKVTRYIVSQSAAERQGGYLEYKPMYISPLAIPEQPDDERISGLVNKIISSKAKNPDEDVSALERQIDRLVYALYGLTEEEIGVVEGNTK